MLKKFLAGLKALLWEPTPGRLPPSPWSHDLGGGWRLEVTGILLTAAGQHQLTALVSPNRRHAWPVTPRLEPGQGYSFCCN